MKFQSSICKCSAENKYFLHFAGEALSIESTWNGVHLLKSRRKSFTTSSLQKGSPSKPITILIDPFHLIQNLISPYFEYAAHGAFYLNFWVHFPSIAVSLTCVFAEGLWGPALQSRMLRRILGCPTIYLLSNLPDYHIDFLCALVLCLILLCVVGTRVLVFEVPTSFGLDVANCIDHTV